MGDWDTVRFAGIFLVIFVHTSQFVGSTHADQSGRVATLINVVTSMITIFFVVSGCVTGAREPSWRALLVRCVSLVAGAVIGFVVVLLPLWRWSEHVRWGNTFHLWFLLVIGLGDVTLISLIAAGRRLAQRWALLVPVLMFAGLGYVVRDTRTLYAVLMTIGAMVAFVVLEARRARFAIYVLMSAVALATDFVPDYEFYAARGPRMSYLVLTACQGVLALMSGVGVNGFLEYFSRPATNLLTLTSALLVTLLMPYQVPGFIQHQGYFGTWSVLGKIGRWYTGSPFLVLLAVQPLHARAYLNNRFVLALARFSMPAYLFHPLGAWAWSALMARVAPDAHVGVGLVGGMVFVHAFCIACMMLYDGIVACVGAVVRRVRARARRGARAAQGEV